MSLAEAIGGLPEDEWPENDPLELTAQMWEYFLEDPKATRRDWLATRPDLAHLEPAPREPRDNRPGHVYLIETVEGPVRFKIGFARHPESRLASLQTGSPMRLRIAATRPGTVELERTIHEALTAYRLHGEWFDGAGFEEAKRLLEEECE